MNFLLVIIVIFLLYKLIDHRSSAVPGSFGFGPDSYEMYKSMVDAGLSLQSLREFVDMENKFLEYEVKSVCRLPVKNYFTEASELSQLMRERFPAFDFKHHQVHLNQIGDPLKVINKNLKCSYFI